MNDTVNACFNFAKLCAVMGPILLAAHYQDNWFLLLLAPVAIANIALKELERKAHEGTDPQPS